MAALIGHRQPVFTHKSSSEIPSTIDLITSVYVLRARDAPVHDCTPDDPSLSEKQSALCWPSASRSMPI